MVLIIIDVLMTGDYILTTYIENRFKEISRDTQNELLYNQWKLDKINVVKILERIKDFFPHYTNHDSSHSEVILNNIYLLVGEEGINRLSSTDLWLLLQVAYFHDIGMIIDKENINATLKNPEFIEYVKKLQKDEVHSLHKYANILEIRDEKLEFTNKELSLETFFYPKYLIADFFRPKHGKRIATNVNETFMNEFTHRDGSLIPKRLYELIYKISVIHTQNFSEIFNLIVKENGFSTDKCHPRLIACLLRLGDLLDLDSNRYDNFMDKLFYGIPLDSIDHITKHRSIDTLNIDNESITIISKVKNDKDYNVYNYTNDWFNWIKDEITNQKLNWHKIVPSNLKISIPLIEKIEVIVEGYSLLPTGEVPHFSFLPEKALEVIEGSQIYEDKSNYLREIIQNAIDSTYLKIWCESKRTNTLDKFPKDSLPDLDNFENYAIKIDVSLDQQETDIKKDENNYYKITIIDKGIGLSVNDLKYLLNVTSSKDNFEREKIIEEMPTYLKPSGNFGIGFQSIFNLTDSVKIKSKSYFSKEEIELVLEKPSKKNNVFFKSFLDMSNKDSYFELSFHYGVKKNVNKYNLNSEDTHLKYTLMETYDIIKDNSFDLEIFDVYTWIKKICKEVLFIPFEISFKDLREFIVPNKENKFLLPSGNFIISIDKNVKISEIYFKGQKLKERFMELNIAPFFNVNIIGYCASKILTYSRNNFKNTDIFNEKYKEFINDLKKFFKSNYSIIEEMRTLGQFSWLLLLSKEIEEPEHFFRNKLLKFDLTSISNSSSSFKNYFDEWIKPFNEKQIQTLEGLLGFAEKETTIEADEFSLKINNIDFYYFLDDQARNFSSNKKLTKKVLIEELYKTHKIIYTVLGVVEEVDKIILRKDNDLVGSSNFYKDSLEFVRKRARAPFNRYIWYCYSSQYEDLIISKDSTINLWIYRPDFFYLLDNFIFMPILLSKDEGKNTFIDSNRKYFIDNIDDDFVNFIQPKLKNKNVKKERIVELYNQLIKELT